MTYKKSILTFGLASLFMTVLLLNSCTSTTENEAETTRDARENLNDAQNELDQAKRDYAIKYEAFKLESDNRITANEEVIAQLKEDSKNKNKELKADLDKKLAELEQRNKDLKQKVRDYKNDGDDKWESFKVEVNHDMDNLGQALKDLGTDNKK